MTEPMLDDGTYDAVVVDAHDVDDAHVAVELTITAGAKKGEVTRVVATRMALRLGARDSVELLGWPCTLVVHGGAPRIEL